MQVNKLARQKDSVRTTEGRKAVEANEEIEKRNPESRSGDSKEGGEPISLGPGPSRAKRRRHDST